MTKTPKQPKVRRPKQKPDPDNGVIGTRDHAAWIAEEERLAEEREDAAARALTVQSVKNMMKPYTPPTGVRKKGMRGMVGDAAPGNMYGMGMAMGIVGTNATLSQMASEGIGFPGYPYLSALALRGEYQNIVGTRTKEFFRKWGHFQSRSGDPDAIKEKVKLIEEEMERLKIRDVQRREFENDEWFGNGLTVALWEGDATDDEELESVLPAAASLKGKRIDRFQNVEPVWCTPDTYEAWNPLLSDFYIPEWWWVMGKRVHVSRIMQTIQRPMHDLFKQAFNFGGLPITLMAKPYVDNWLRTRQNVADIINTLRVFVVKEDLTMSATGLKTKDAPGGSGKTLRQALRTWQRTMDNFGVMALSKDGGLDVASTSLSDLHDLQGQSLENICCITNIPVIKFTTNQPAGLNATSDGTIRTFYDTGRSIRENDIGPSLNRKIDLIQMTLFGEVDPDIEWVWDDLFEETPADKLEMESKKSQIRASDAQNGFITAEEGREQIEGDADSIYASSNVDLSEPPEDYPGDDEDGDPDTPEKVSPRAAGAPDGLGKLEGQGG